MSEDIKMMDDSMDPELQGTAGLDEESDDAEGGSVHIETLSQVAPKPIQSWLIKIPKELENEWSKITESGVPLGKLRHYPQTDTHERAFVLVVPEPRPNDPEDPAPTANRASQGSSSSKSHKAPAAAQTGQPRMVEYMLSETEQSQKLARQKFLYLEDRRRYEFNGTSKRRAHPRLVQAVSKQCNLVPRVSAKRMAQLIREQYARPEETRKKTKLLNQEALTAGQRNSLATGNSLMSNSRGKNSMRIHHQTVKHKDPRSQKERTFRMAKQNLIDTLFDEFGRYKYWSMRALRERLMQPEAWLKECLLEVAEQEQDGPYKNLYRLKTQFAGMNAGAGLEQAPDNQEVAEVARLALAQAEDGASDDDEAKPKREGDASDTADDAELKELEYDDDEDMEEVKV